MAKPQRPPKPAANSKAANDVGATSEDVAISIDVLANDSGNGNTLYSLNQSDPLVIQTVAVTALGATIRIVNGQVLYDSSTAVMLQALAAGQTATDTFTYAMQGANGQISTATVSVTVTGTNDAPTTTAVMLASVAEDSGPRLITQAELLANATDVDTPSLTATGLAISSGIGSLIDNGNGTWTFAPALNDDTAVSFSYSVSDGSLSTAGTATLDITPVNDAPNTGAVTLASVAEDSGARLITQADLLANATDIDSASLIATSLAISSGSGSLAYNGNGTWTFTPAINDDTAVSFSYSVTDGALSVAGTATLDITPLNDAPITGGVTLAAMAEDSGPRLITQAALLANATDVDGPALTATGLTISSGNGSLIDNGNGTWTYTPALNDDTGVSFGYIVTDGSLSVAGTATLDITPVNDAPTSGAVTLVAIAEDSGARLITQTELLANASDVDGHSLAATGIMISSGNGLLFANGNGTWTFTPALNDDTAVSFSYSVTDGALSAAGTATLDITPVNDAPITGAVTLAAMAEDSGPRLITQAALLANAADVDGPALTATGLAVSSGNGSLTANGDGSWTFTPVLNDDTGVSFSYSVTDGALSAAGAATLDITPVNDAPVAVADHFSTNEDTALTVLFPGVLGNDSDVEGLSLSAILTTNPGHGTVTLNGNGSFTYTPATNYSGSDSFTYQARDGSLNSAPATVTIDVMAVADAPILAVNESAQATEIGDELLVNTSIAGSQGSPSAATLTNGRFVVTWQDGGSGNALVKGQLFTPTGEKFGSEFTVSDPHPTFNSGQGSVAALSTGGFAVAWRGVDAAQGGIRVRLFNADGDTVGSEFLANTTTTNVQEFPSIAGLANGGFVVTWTDSSLLGGDNSATAVKAQVFDAAGQKTGGEFLVNTRTFSSQGDSDVASLPNGDFVIAWMDASGQGGDPSMSIKAQKYDAAGQRIGAEFLANTTTVDHQTNPSITTLTDGRYVIAWTDFSRLGVDKSGSAVTAQIFDSNGKVGGEIRVSTSTLNNQEAASIAALPNGGFVVAWQDESDRGVVENGASVRAQMFDSAGSKVGGEFLVDTRTISTSIDQSFTAPSLTALANGKFAATWTDGGTQGPDTSSFSVKAQIFSSTASEDSAIPLAATAALKDADGSETLAVVAGNIPVGATLGDGAGHTFTAAPESTGTDISAWSLAGLNITPAPNFSGSFTLTFTATATEAANSSAASTSMSTTVTVSPVPDTFVFETPANAGAILNFTTGSDVLQISAAGFGGGLMPGATVTLVTAEAASGASSGSAAGYFIFDNAGADAGTVFWDPTGDSGTDATPIATLAGAPSLLPADFHVV